LLSIFPNPMTIFLQHKSCLTRCALALTLALVVSPAQAGNEIGVPLAEVNGQTVTVEDLDHALGVKLTELQEQLYALKRAELDALIAQRLLAQEAAKRGVSVAALLDAEVTAKVVLVTETEIESVYQEEGEKGTGYFNFGGRPRRRKVDSSPRAVASRCCHSGAPNGCWRLTQVRSAVSSCSKSG